MSFNLIEIKKQVVIAIKAGDTLHDACVELQTLLKGADQPTVKGIVCPIVSAYYKVKTPEAESGFANGEWVDSKCAAKRKANRLIKAIIDPEATPKQSAHIAVDEKVLAALVDTVVKAGMSKKEFGAMLTALRAAISFE
ncbi:hypothetical protein UFOVP1276_8 [uncultured Caudovirales phage]|uniref:Uncharacterized protein n=1 Tax=uncultured Caudovirales phage TaxID=2100421 RepID=A0A6J7XUW8_9CAUD|nr:hypothetical protein UFOVP875_39 [uncultured Caudovirales phage]CAB4194884.1 hypothetical protein UFOVP1276_8 [uncultured Caudovirales phage]CAB4205280.1 hypothetical protein UFOVP1403_58 [uncultured Caudovirales phage]CAB5238106.1 hypothetical protein UFOVP1507_42 [uncultured Caudovirales phage]